MGLRLHNTRKAKIPARGNAVARMTTPEGTDPYTMRRRTPRVAAELNVPVPSRKVPGGPRS